MANLEITHDDLINTLQAQRNEAWDAAARAGAAAQAAMRQVDGLQKELAETKAKLDTFEQQNAAARERAGDYAAQAAAA